jgi:uncharacterized membrane protein (DUF4010 family)
MTPPPLLIDFVLLLGLSLFFGLAFEEFHAQSGMARPGGVRTFPLLALGGGVLYRLDPTRLLPLAAGLVVLGAWLAIYYRAHLRAPAPDGAPSAELVVPVCNVLAFLIGPVAFAEPHWVAVAVTVAAVLLLTAREWLHGLARQVALSEILTAAKFLILTGIVLPLLPDRPVTSLTAITPYKVWLALLAVTTVSYASYLAQRFLRRGANDLVVAVLGGLYSSTATTVVLARRAAAEHGFDRQARAGIVIATAIMYVRILVIVALFDAALALRLVLPMVILALAGVVLAVLLFLRARGAAPTMAHVAPRNPLELWAAAVFAVLFVLVSVLAGWAREHYGALGLDALAAVVGVSDVDPFVLSIAAGGTTALPGAAAATAILIATGSNNLLKAAYTVAFLGPRASFPAVAALVALAAGSGAAAWLIAAG